MIVAKGVRLLAIQYPKSCILNSVSGVIKAFGNAFRSILHPQMLALAIWPMLVALALWIGLAWWYWDSWVQWFSSILTGSYVTNWLSQRTLDALVHYSALLLLIALLVPMTLITAVSIAALVEMPLIVRFVATHDYPALEKRHGGSVVGGVANALSAVLIFAGLWIATLPLWLTGVLAPVLVILLSAYLNQRLFRYDALSEHASAEEYRVISELSWGRMFMLGMLTGVLYFVPLLNLLAPVLSGLAFTHFGLAELARLRQMKV